MACWVGIVGSGLAVLTVRPAVATTTCLTGTDPVVAGDAAQIRAARAQIDAACVCASFDGSAGNTHADYFRCAAGVIRTHAATAGFLRPECIGTVERYYNHSTCGRDPRRHFAPCIETNPLDGAITCAIRPTTKPDGITATRACVARPGTALRVPCANATHCIDAADTNHDLVIATPGDTGACAPQLNFLVINLDDTRPDGMDRMAVVQSRLAPESLTFQNSFVPYSSCCPSRASLLSGLYAVHHGTRQVIPPLGGASTFRISGADHETLAVWLHDAGYATGLFGKYLNDYAPESNQGPNGGFYIPPGWTRWRAFVIEHYGGMNGPSYELVDENGVRTPYDDHTTDAQYSTDITAQAVRQFIGDSAAAGQPFFALWEPYASHGDTPGLLPIPAAQDANTLTDLGLFRPPNYDEPDRSDKPRWAQALISNAILEAVTDVEREAAYETLLSVDREIGLMLDQLETLGLADHTVVLLTSDNGVSWGEHAQFAQTKSSAYEENLRVQFMIHVPGGAVGTTTAPVLNIDVAPTIADLAGVEVRVPVDGQSIRPLLEGAPDLVRSDFLLEQWREFSNASITYSGQPADGDRLQLYYGPDFPKAVVTFEFDTGDGVAPGTIAVPIQDTAEATYYGLGAAVVGAVPNSQFTQNDTAQQLGIIDTSAAQTGFYWWSEINQADGFTVTYPLPDFFGVRDVRNGYMYVHYEDGETELYDMNVDPWQLNNAADDPAYAAVRAGLDARMRTLAGLP